MMHGDDIVWVRSLSGYRLGVLLPKGFAFISSNVAAQLTTTGRRSAEAGVREPERPEQSGDDPRAQDDGDVPAARRHRHVLRRREDAVRPGGAGSRARQGRADLQRLPQGRHARSSTRSAQLPLQDLKVIDLDTGKPFSTAKDGAATFVKLDVPIVDDKQSAHIKITGAFRDPGYKVVERRAGVRPHALRPAQHGRCCRRAGRCRRSRSRARSAPTRAARSSR